MREIVALVAVSDVKFSCFIADRDTADPIERFGSSWAAYEKLATQLIIANVTPGEVVTVLSDEYSTPPTYSFERSVKRQVNNRLGRLSVVEVNKLDSRSTLGLQLVDIVTSAIAFEFRLLAGVATSGSPKDGLAEHTRKAFGVQSAVGGCLAENLSVKIYEHERWRKRARRQ